MPVPRLHECFPAGFDRLLIATLGDPAPLIDRLVGTGVAAHKLLTLKAEVRAHG
jgi:hypothetical protein